MFLFLLAEKNSDVDEGEPNQKQSKAVEGIALGPSPCPPPSGEAENQGEATGGADSRANSNQWDGEAGGRRPAVPSGHRRRGRVVTSPVTD